MIPFGTDPFFALTNAILLAVAIINMIFGTVVFFNKGKMRSLYTAFCVLAVCVSAWTFVIIYYRSTAVYEDALLALKLLYLVPVTIPALFVVFAYIYSGMPRSIFTHRSVRSLAVLFAVAIGYVSYFTGYFVTDIVIPPQGEKIIIFGDFYAMYVTYFLIGFGWGFYLLLRQFITHPDRTMRIQSLFLFVGTFTASGVSLITNLILPWYGIFALNWFGNASTILFVGFIFYAIVRHKLFDIKIVATELLTFGIWLLFMFRLFASQNTTEQVINIVSLFASIGLGVFIIQSVKKEIHTREELQQTLDKLEEANRRLTVLDKQKTEFVSVASHQLRAPTAAIRGYASLILDGSFGKVPPSIREAMERIAESGKAMADMVEDFLNISRIEQGRMKFQMSDFDFHKTTEKVIENMARVAKAKGVDFRFIVVTHPRGFMIHGDEGKLRQVVSNLIDNALKYTEKGFVEVRLSREANRPVLHLDIKDSGIGISKEDQWQLFAKFQRADNANTTNVHGTGLGLYVAKEMVQAHSGVIWVESEGRNKGSIFHVELTTLP